MKSVSKLILVVAGLVSVGLMVAFYFLFSGFSSYAMQQSAFSQARIVSSLTFSNMYQLMNKGWKRDQVLDFTRSAAESVEDSPVRIEFWRGRSVNQLFGEIPQGPLDPYVEKALRTGRSQEVATEQGGRYIYALSAEAKCLGCHTNAKKGDVLGAIAVEAKFARFMNDTRQLLMVVLLLIVPLPFIVGWMVALYLHSRMERFAIQMDTVIAQVESQPDAVPDFTPVKPSFLELAEILERIRKLADVIRR